MYALLVIVWLAVRVAEVMSTASSKVTVMSNVPVSASSPCAQSIEIGCAEPKESAKLRIQTKISGAKHFRTFWVIDTPHSRSRTKFFESFYFGFANFEADTSVSEKVWTPDGTEVSAS